MLFGLFLGVALCWRLLQCCRQTRGFSMLKTPKQPGYLHVQGDDLLFLIINLLLWLFQVNHAINVLKPTELQFHYTEPKLGSCVPAHYTTRQPTAASALAALSSSKPNGRGLVRWWPAAGELISAAEGLLLGKA